MHEKMGVIAHPAIRFHMELTEESHMPHTNAREQIQTGCAKVGCSVQSKYSRLLNGWAHIYCGYSFLFLHCESFRLIFSLVFLFPLHEKSPLVLTCSHIAFIRPQTLQ